jgi:hypothetical protein
MHCTCPAHLLFLDLRYLARRRGVQTVKIPIVPFSQVSYCFVLHVFIQDSTCLAPMAHSISQSDHNEI